MRARGKDTMERVAIPGNVKGDDDMTFTTLTTANSGDVGNIYGHLLA